MSKSKFEFGLMPDPDPQKNCGYTIKGQIKPELNDNIVPYWSNVCKFKQWCLIFKKSPTTIFVDFYPKKISTIHSVLMEMKDFAGDKIGRFHRRLSNYIFDIRQDCEYIRKMWTVEDISKPYALCVCRESANIISEFILNIFGNEEFQIFEIKDNNEIGERVPKFDVDYSYLDELEQAQKELIEFEEINIVEQPLNFTPKKSENQISNQKENTNAVVNKLPIPNNSKQKPINNGLPLKTDNQIIAQNPKVEDANKCYSKCCLLI